jgi:hypothetical protein
MAGGSAIRGSRIGAGPAGEADRGDSAPRQRIQFHCGNGHVTARIFAVDADIPDQWDCPRCGLPAGQDASAPPAAPRNEPYKSHLAYVKERRTDEEGDALLAEALERVADKRRPH